MANIKKSIEVNENLEANSTSKVVAQSSTQSTEKVDINKLIQDAIAKAVMETSKTYQDKIEFLETKIKEQESEKQFAKTAKQDEVEMSIRPDKMIWIQHMAPGGAGFHKGRINITFDKLFDKKRIKWEVLDEMYYEFRAWFDNSEIAILDSEARNYYGIDEMYKETGADESKFIKMLSMKNSEMIDEVSKFSYMVSSAFLKYFIDQYLAGNQNCLKDGKFKAIQKHYQEQYNINNLQEIIQEMNQ